MLSLALSTSPDSIRILQRVTTKPRTRTVVRGDVTTPGLVGVEGVVHQHGLAGARLRFGVAAPTTLRTFKGDECAVSDLAMLDPDIATPPADPWSAMLGSTRLTRPRIIRIAWESYGYPAGDSVAIAVRIARRSKLTAMERLSIKFGIAEDPNSAIRVQWSEPTPGRSTVTVPSSVPTAVRELRLDVSRFTSGDYQLEVVMERAGCPSAHGERAIVIDR